MSEEKKQKSLAEEQGSKSMTDFLAAKQRLASMLEEHERAMEEQFKRLVTIMFTDIKGSTSFYERHGDLEGRMMVEQHNKLLFPVVAEFGGTIIKTIGDAIMAKFPDPASGARAAVTMQKILLEYRQGKRAYPLHVRIGVHYGYGMVEENDVFGDVVNCAARVESLADGDEVLITGEVYDHVRDADDLIVRFKEETKVKGKEESVKVYRLIWNEADLVAEDEEMKKTGTRRASARRSEELVELTASREGEVIKLSAGERHKGQQRTISHYEEARISNDEVAKLCAEVTTLLNRANKRGKITKEILKQLKDVGSLLYDKILTPEAKKSLQATKADELVIHMDDKLVQIPWELMYDGKEFLCLRFALGRVVSTKQKIAASKIRRIGHPLRMLVLSDPRGDLPASSEEGRELRTQLEPMAVDINVHLKNGAITREFVESKLRNYDLVHYAGHADYDPNNPTQSGWLVQDGRISSGEITKLGGSRPMPALVFSNACQSGQTEEWKIDDNFEHEIYGLANAFLLSGVQHYIGTFWDILDTPSQHFSTAFYKGLMEGQSVGTAVKNARIALIQRYGEENIVWASYMLYGDPGFAYHQPGAMLTEADGQPDDFTEARPAAGGEMPSGALRGAAAATLPAPAMAQPRSMKGLLIGAAAAGLAILLGVAFALSTGGTRPMADDGSIAAQAYGYLKAGEMDKAQTAFSGLASDRDTGAKGHEGLAALAFTRADYQSASDEANQALQLDKDNVYAKVILGNIAFNQGDLAAAEAHYRAATESTGGEVWQKSEAYNRLGRVYAAGGNLQGAVAQYSQAIQTDGTNAEAYANQGRAYEQLGQPEQAVASYKTGAQANPNDPMTNRLLAGALASQQVRGNKEKMDAINQQVGDLVKRYNDGKALAGTKTAPEDDWTSRPVDITFIDFANKGNQSMRDGENEYLLLKIIDRLQEKGRVQVVEREMIDQLLGELNLSSSQLADKETALKLGRLIGARMISTGSLIRHADEVQISLRMIETETSRIPASVTETFRAGDSLDSIAVAVADKLAARVGEAFPLQGRILEVAAGQVTLNIGKKHGVAQGLQLEIIDDATPIKAGDKILGYKKEVVGKIEITQAEDGFSMAKVVEGQPTKDRKVAQVRN